MLPRATSRREDVRAEERKPRTLWHSAPRGNAKLSGNDARETTPEKRRAEERPHQRKQPGKATREGDQGKSGDYGKDTDAPAVISQARV